MRGQQQCAVGVIVHPLTDEPAYIPRRLHVEAERRLVEEDDVGIGHKAANEVHFLAQARREIGNLGAHPFFQPHNPRHSGDAVFGHFVFQPIKAGKHPQAFLNGEQAVATGFAAAHHADAPLHFLGIAHHVKAIDARRAAARQQKRRQNYECRLACTVRPEQPKQSAALDLQINAVEGHPGRRVTFRLRAANLVDAPHILCFYGERVTQGLLSLS